MVRNISAIPILDMESARKVYVVVLNAVMIQQVHRVLDSKVCVKLINRIVLGKNL